MNMEFTNKQLQKIPVKSGIYYLYENDNLLYIGKARNLKRRVLQHYSKIPNQQIDYIIDKVTKIKIKLLPEYAIHYIEKSQIYFHRPILNKETLQDYPEIDEMIRKQVRQRLQPAKQFWNLVSR